jgi:hypothetical protein
MQGRIDKKRSRYIGDVRDHDGGRQYDGGTNAFKHAPDGTFAVIGWRTAWHVSVIDHQRFNGCCGTGNSGSPDWRQSERGGDQSHQNHTSEKHVRTIWRYGLRVNRVVSVLM